jgi:hypothetical protein
MPGRYAVVFPLFPAPGNSALTQRVTEKGKYPDEGLKATSDEI